MASYDDQDEFCECNVCDMVDEFRELVKDEVDWESALRHVLHMTISKTQTIEDELLAEVVDDAFSEGFEEGVLSTLTQAQELMDSFVDEVTDKVYDIRDRRENPEDYKEETESKGIEDLTDEQVDEIQENIRKSLQ